MINDISIRSVTRKMLLLLINCLSFLLFTLFSLTFFLHMYLGFWNSLATETVRVVFPKLFDEKMFHKKTSWSVSSEIFIVKQLIGSAVNTYEYIYLSQRFLHLHFECLVHRVRASETMTGEMLASSPLHHTPLLSSFSTFPSPKSLPLWWHCPSLRAHCKPIPGGLSCIPACIFPALPSNNQLFPGRLCSRLCAWFPGWKAERLINYPWGLLGMWRNTELKLSG